jgi:hypothetical protein
VAVSIYNMETMLSERGKTLMVIDGAKFRKGRTLSSGKTYWRCSNKNCKPNFYITSRNDMIESNLNHNHDPSDIYRQKISNSVKRKAEEDISVRPTKLIHSLFTKKFLHFHLITR